MCNHEFNLTGYSQCHLLFPSNTEIFLFYKNLVLINSSLRAL